MSQQMLDSGDMAIGTLVAGKREDAGPEAGV